MDAGLESGQGEPGSELGRRLVEIQGITTVARRIAEYKRLVEDFPGAALAVLRLAHDLWENGQRSEACDAARRLVHLAPELVEQLPVNLAAAVRPAAGPGWDDNPLDRLGQIVDGFRITHRIAEDPRTVLYQVERGPEAGYLRVLRPALSREAAVASRFVDSAELLRRVRHPGLVTILDAGTLPDGCTYLLMQPQPGELLSERIWRKEPLAPLAPGLCALADALAALHARGLCYLGIQPERIQIAVPVTPSPWSSLQLLDSEYARTAGPSLPAQLPTITNDLIRKGVDPVLFMAPESFGGQVEVGPPADAYGLGVLAYLVLCGRLPFEAERGGEIVAAHLNQPPAPLRAPDIPQPVASLVEAMLDKNPEQRPAMARVAAELRRLLSTPATHEIPAPPPAGEAQGEQRLGEYQLLRKIGEGRTGEVFEAYHERLRRRDAIKLIRAEVCRSPEDAERFLREVQAANQVAHPGIVSILQQARAPSGRIYTVMEYLGSDTLRARIKRGPLPPVAVMRLSRHVAIAMAAAHEQGIIHRDLKPENVFVVPDPEVPGRERTKIVDFGTANLTQAPRGAPYVEGTPPYMSPEQLRDTGTAGTKTDVFALGVMMSEMLTGGVRPGAPVTPTGCPVGLAALVRRMRDPDHDLRPSMRQVADELEVLLSAPARRFPWRRAGLAAGLVAVVGGVVVAASQLWPFHGTATHYRLSVARIGPGTVTGTGIDCGTDCEETYARGFAATLSAAPAQLASFAGWSGCDSTSGVTCQVKMTAAKTAIATFTVPHRPEPTTYALTVTKTGPGAGTVSATGIDCGADCTQSYARGTLVSLAAAPTDPSLFGGWAGCDSTSGTACTVTVDAAKTVTATFNLPIYRLTVVKSGAGNGTVMAIGIWCGSDCRETYPIGTAVTLIAVATSPSAFSGWTGCDSTSGPMCRVTVNAARTVTAVFRNPDAERP